MTGMAALLKKEIKEQLRTYRLLIVASVFLLFGLATPLLLRYMPELLELAGEDIVIELPPPTALQALAEYTDTIVQVGVLVAVLITMGAVSRERERGTAAMVLAKPVGRGAFVAVKLAATSISFVVALGLASVASYGYTVMLLGPADVAAFLALNLLLALFFVFCLSVTLLFSTIFRSSLAAGGVALAVLIGQALIAGLPRVGDYMPAGLISWGSSLLAGDATTAWGAVVSSLVIIAGCLYLARLILRQKEL